MTRKIYRITVGVTTPYAKIHAQMGQDIYHGNKLQVMWDDWLAKNNAIADFIFSMYTICRRDIAKELTDKFNGLAIVELEWSINPKQECAKNLSRLKWLPQGEVDLCAIISDVEVPILPSSTLQYGLSGLTGKECVKKIIGAAYLKGDMIIPREKDKGIYFSSQSLNNHHFFRAENASFLLCTEDVRRYAIAKNYTNVIFLEVGEVVD